MHIASREDGGVAFLRHVVKNLHKVEDLNQYFHNSYNLKSRTSSAFEDFVQTCHPLLSRRGNFIIISYVYLWTLDCRKQNLIGIPKSDTTRSYEDSFSLK